MPIALDQFAGDRPGFGGPHRLGNTATAWEPHAGNVVLLRSGFVVIIVRIVVAANRQYTGEVIGFEGHDGDDYEGLLPGDRVHFTYANIFQCGR
jgi:hypothetical protein